MDGLVDAEGSDIHFAVLRDLGRQALDIALALDRLEDATVGDTGGLADEVERDRHGEPFGEIHFEEIGVQDVAAHRVNLHLAQQHRLVV